MGYLVYTPETHHELSQGCHFYSEMSIFQISSSQVFHSYNSYAYTYDKSIIRAQPILNLRDFKEK